MAQLYHPFADALRDQFGLYALAVTDDIVAGVTAGARQLFRAAGDLDAVYVPVGMGSGIVGTIAGRAVYDGSLDFQVAQELADQLGA